MKTKPVEPTANTLYQKQGKKFVPVAEHFAYDYFHEGWYTLHVTPGSRSMVSHHYRPNYEPLMCAAQDMKDELVKIIADASQPTPSPKPLSKKELSAWRDFEKAMASPVSLWSKSTYSIASKVVDKIVEKALNKK